MPRGTGKWDHSVPVSSHVVGPKFTLLSLSLSSTALDKSRARPSSGKVPILDDLSRHPPLKFQLRRTATTPHRLDPLPSTASLGAQTQKKGKKDGSGHVPERHGPPSPDELSRPRRLPRAGQALPLHHLPPRPRPRATAEGPAVAGGGGQGQAGHAVPSVPEAPASSPAQDRGRRQPQIRHLHSDGQCSFECPSCCLLF